MDSTKAVKAGLDALEFIQAGGTAAAMTVDIRKPGGSQWGADWCATSSATHTPEPEPLDVAITLPYGPEMVSRSEVFTADEAAELFFTYYKTGDIPSEFTLRPVLQRRDCHRLRQQHLSVRGPARVRAAQQRAHGQP